MRTIIALTFLTMFSVSSMIAGAGSVCAAKVSNVTCIGTNLSFNLTLTENGVPITIMSTDGIKFEKPKGTLVFHVTPIGGAVNNQSYNATPINCSSIIGMSFFVSLGGGANPDFCSSDPPSVSFSVAEIPALGQWGLIILSLVLLSFGVVAVRRHNKTIAQAPS